MISRHSALIALLLSVTLAACGGGDAGDAPADTVTKVAPTKLLVIGNSLTLHPPAPNIGWAGNWGMAASTAAQDFAHLSGKSLGVPVTPLNYFLETTNNAPDITRYPAMLTAGTVVVVQLGENVANDLAFLPAYKALLATVKPAHQVLCVGSWWLNADPEAALKAACEEAGGTYVFIGDLFTSAANQADKLVTPYAHPGVNDHPHDWGMSQIAVRVVAAVRR